MHNSNKSKVSFFSSDITFKIKNSPGLKHFIEDLFKKEKRILNSINYIFCSDRYLLKINQKYLKHNYYTDIITFDLSDKSGGIEAEIYISIDRVRENAKGMKTTIKSELHRVIFHGALHLCGYSDKSSRQINLMRKKEDAYMERYFM
jgi:probable rRNA maturation factor